MSARFRLSTFRRKSNALLLCRYCIHTRLLHCCHAPSCALHTTRRRSPPEKSLSNGSHGDDVKRTLKEVSRQLPYSQSVVRN